MHSPGPGPYWSPSGLTSSAQLEQLERVKARARSEGNAHSVSRVLLASRGCIGERNKGKVWELPWQQAVWYCPRPGWSWHEIGISGSPWRTCWYGEDICCLGVAWFFLIRYPSIRPVVPGTQGNCKGDSGELRGRRGMTWRSISKTHISNTGVYVCVCAHMCVHACLCVCLHVWVIASSQAKQWAGQTLLLLPSLLIELSWVCQSHPKEECGWSSFYENRQGYTGW